MKYSKTFIVLINIFALIFAIVLGLAVADRSVGAALILAIFGFFFIWVFALIFHKSRSYCSRCNFKGGLESERMKKKKTINKSA
jgi:hypothetical protein